MRGPMAEYPNKEFGDAVPRAGNASGGGQPGSALRCAPGGPNDYVYVIIQPPSWAPLMRIIGREELIDDPHYATPEARLSHIPDCFSIIEQWTMTKTKFEVMDALNAVDVPCGPILSMKDIYEDRELYRTRLAGRDRSPRARPLRAGRDADQTLRLAGRRKTLAAIGRTHRRGARLARLRRCRHQEIARRRRGVVWRCIERVR